MVCIQHPYNSQNIVFKQHLLVLLPGDLYVMNTVYVYCTPCRSRHCECKKFRSYEEETSFKSCFINQKTPKVLRSSVSSTSGIKLTMMKLSKGNDKRITPMPGPRTNPV
jgi:hypothetical protein